MTCGVKIENLALIFACKPSLGVSAETTMCKEISNRFLDDFDKDKMVCTFPDIMSNLVGNDASFEMVLSNTLQTMLMTYSHNEVSQTRAVIFVTTKIEHPSGEKVYRDALS